MNAVLLNHHSSSCHRMQFNVIPSSLYCNLYHYRKKSQRPEFKTHPLIHQEKLNNIQEIHPKYQHIFTNGSKRNYGTGCGAVLHKKSLKKCLPKEASIFSAKIYDLISTSSSKNFIIHSDSISVLQSLKSTKLENPLIVQISKKLNSLIHNKKVIFCWIPSYIGIQGNDKADSSAKAVINMTLDKNIKIPYTDHNKIQQIVSQTWQQLSDKNLHNKLF